MALRHSLNPIYLGVTLDRTIYYKEHATKLKAKVNTRINNIISKLANLKFGANATTVRTMALSLCYYAAKYAYPLLERSSYAHKINPALNNTCRCITECLKAPDVNKLYILTGIAPPDIRRRVHSQAKRRRQVTDQRHQMYGNQPAPCRMKSRHSFMSDVLPLSQLPESERMELLKKRLKNSPDEDISCEISVATGSFGGLRHLGMSQ